MKIARKTSFVFLNTPIRVDNNLEKQPRVHACHTKLNMCLTVIPPDSIEQLKLLLQHAFFFCEFCRMTATRADLPTQAAGVS